VNFEDEEDALWGKKVNVWVGSSGRRTSYSLSVSSSISYKEEIAYCSFPSAVRIQRDSPDSPNGCQSTFSMVD
jgi:hypothetical protein